MSGERAPANRSIRSDRVPAARERDEVPGHGVREAGGGGSDRFRIKIIDTTRTPWSMTTSAGPTTWTSPIRRWSRAAASSFTRS